MNATLAEPTQLKVLIIEDNDSDAELMLFELRRTGLSIATTRVQTAAEFHREVLLEPDAILSDYTLPGFGARKALEMCQNLGLDIPFIVVTGSISEEVAVDCMKRGAVDYLLKDRLSRLGSALEQAVTAKRIRDQKKRAERARDAAMRELDHRVRNNMGVVVGLAELTARSAQELVDFTPAFMGRVRALATVHDALREQQWLGVDLRSLITRIIQQLTTLSPDKVQIDGPDFSLSPRAVQPIGLALHELARNSTLLGAWSAPGGSVHISWQPESEETILLSWEEHGGPRPAPNTAHGAGLTLAHDLITRELGGNLSIDFAAQGLHATIRFPVKMDP